jgi:hypothetical protein
MGAGKLRTVVETPASGAVASAPLTLLTTAAANTAGALNSNSFKTNYGTVAGNFGLTDTNPASDPNAASALKTALTELTTVVGGDTTALDAIVGNIAEGTLKSNGSHLAAEAAINCEPLAASDLKYTYTSMFPMMIMDPVTFMPIMSMQTITHEAPAYGFGSAGDACLVAADGLSSSRASFNGSLGNLLGGAAVSGNYTVYRYANATCQGEYTYGSTSATVQHMGTQALALSASADPSKSQAGTVDKLVVTLQPSQTLGITHATTENHLFCRTQAAPSGTVNFQGFLTKAGSPLVNGYLSRIDGSHQLTGWTD